MAFVPVPTHGNAVDLSKKRYGILTVSGFARRLRAETGTILVWRCRCDCGREIEVRGSNLQRGNTKSCGCASRRVVSR